MAGIQVGGGHGKRALDADIPLVPFIDLLLCCVMFLLVTAVWNELSQVRAAQETPGPATDPTPPVERERLTLLVQASGYVLASRLGDRTEIDRVGGRYDDEGLRHALADRARLSRERAITVAPEDGIAYRDVVAAMDVAMGAGYAELSVEDAAAP